jgi:hypothetical protein
LGTFFAALEPKPAMGLMSSICVFFGVAKSSFVTLTIPKLTDAGSVPSAYIPYRAPGTRIGLEERPPGGT